jgi:SprT protein
MKIIQAIKQRVTARLRSDLDKIEKRYGTKLDMPNVAYDVRGVVAGYASHSAWLIRLNPDLLVANLEDFLIRTVPHELAHLACHRIYPEAYERDVSAMFSARTGRMKFRRAKREVHGPRWKEIMRVLGADPKRTHNYDVSSTRRSRKARYQYKCSRCGEMLYAGPKVHKHIQRDPSARWHRGCKGHRLILQGIQGKHVPAAADLLAVPRATPTPATGTKQQRAMALYRGHPGADRGTMIAMFMAQLAMTQAGASTYYYNCQKVR